MCFPTTFTVQFFQKWLINHKLGKSNSQKFHKILLPAVTRTK